MKIIGMVEIQTVTEVVCDICQLTTRVDGSELQFASLQAHWGFGAKHDGERYEFHLCEGCFFQAVASLKQERRIQGLAMEDGAFGTAMILAWSLKMAFSETPAICGFEDFLLLRSFTVR